MSRATAANRAPGEGRAQGESRATGEGWASGGSGAVGFGTHVRRGAWELLCLTLAATCVAVCFSEGFEVPAEVSGRFAPAFAVCLALNAAAYAFSYSRRTAAAGFVALALGAALACALVWGDGGGETSAYLVSVCVSDLLLFFLTRPFPGAVIAVPLGLVVIAGGSLLEYGSHPVLAGLFLFAATSVLLVRRYRASMLRNSTLRPNVGRHALVCALVCGMSLALATGVYWVLIEPFSPPSLELQLKTALQRLPLLEKLGVSSHIYLPDPDRASRTASDEETIADLVTSEDESEAPVEAPDDEDEGMTFELPVLFDAQPVATAVTYISRDYTWAYVCGGVLGSVALLFGGKAVRRRVRLRRVLGLPPRERVVAMYACVLRFLQVCGVPPVGSRTPFEYCRDNEAAARRFLGADALADLTGAFERAFYGGIEPAPDELARFEDLCRALPRLSRQALGFPRAVGAFFRL